jgi:hypothetical protein
MKVLGPAWLDCTHTNQETCWPTAGDQGYLSISKAGVIIHDFWKQRQILWLHMIMSLMGRPSSWSPQHKSPGQSILLLSTWIFTSKMMWWNLCNKSFQRQPLNYGDVFCMFFMSVCCTVHTFTCNYCKSAKSKTFNSINSFFLVCLIMQLFVKQLIVDYLSKDIGGEKLILCIFFCLSWSMTCHHNLMSSCQIFVLVFELIQQL